jgi:predicted molibdopterin-dependent oxidoreductase YjgC
MNAKDAKTIPVQQGGEVKIDTRLGSVKATVSITEKVLPGVVFIPHLPTSDLASPRNTVDPRALLPELNTAVCQIKKSGGK